MDRVPVFPEDAERCPFGAPLDSSPAKAVHLSSAHARLTSSGAAAASSSTGGVRSG